MMLRFYHCKRQWKYCLLLQLSKLPHHMFISRQICFVALANFSMELWKYWKYWKELDHLVLFELIEQKWLVLNSSRRPKYWMATTLHPVDCQHTHCIRSSRHTWTSTWSQVPERAGNLDVHVREIFKWFSFVLTQGSSKQVVLQISTGRILHSRKYFRQTGLL